MTNQIKELYEDYNSLYNEDPFSQDTIEMGETVLSLLSQENQQ